MYKRILFAVILTAAFSSTACAPVTYDRYNTQKGAAVGAGLGAILGQAIGRNTGGTLIGMATGTVLGSLVGNAYDQSYARAAARDAARTGKRVVYYDTSGGAVEAVPSALNQRTKCRKVRNRTWNNGTVTKDTIEEVCEGEKVTGEY